MRSTRLRLATGRFVFSRLLLNCALMAVLGLIAQLALAPEAFAQAAAPGAAVSPLMQYVPIVFMLGVMYLLMIRPQMKKQKELQAYLAGLKHGDSVITTSGMLGVIKEIQGAFVTLEVSQGVRVKVLRSAIAQSAEKAMASDRSGAEVKA